MDVGLAKYETVENIERTYERPFDGFEVAPIATQLFGELWLGRQNQNLGLKERYKGRMSDVCVCVSCFTIGVTCMYVHVKG